MSLLSEQLTEAVKMQHAEWMQYPVTRAVLSAIMMQEQSLTNTLISSSYNISMTDSDYRKTGVSLKAVVLLKNIITDSEVLVKLLTPAEVNK